MAKNWGPVAPTKKGMLQPLERSAVTLGNGALGTWAERNRSKTLPHVVAMLERSGTIDNFRRLVGESDAPYRGMLFQDSDLYKSLEAIAWALGVPSAANESSADAELRAFFDAMVDLLARVQLPNGYLNSCFQRPDREHEPWSDLVHGHELYCLGHLIQAAVASSRSLGDDRLLAIANRYVDHVIDLFGAPDSTVLCGHPEIETALIELYRLTGDSTRLDLAVAFLDRRGHHTFAHGRFGAQYYQDDVPVRATTIMRGHAVRALYLNAAVTDAFLENGDESLLSAVRTQWQDLLSHRLYLTGGTGSRHRDEAFGDAYELPSERAYAETCAGIALMHWAWRLFLTDGSAGALDEFERALYNVVSAGISADGTSFFYSNPLQRRPEHQGGQEEGAGVRLAWYSCACCPPNLARLFASLDSYLAAVTEHEVRIGLYTSAELSLPHGLEPVRLRMETNYPAEGRIRIEVLEGQSEADLLLRQPAWASSATVSVDGTQLDIPAEHGWIRLNDVLRAGTVIVLDLPMVPKVIRPHPHADGIRGTAALTRGPVVYCAEQRDNVCAVDSLLLADGTEAETLAGEELGPLLELRAWVDRREPTTIPLYVDSYAAPELADARIVLRPYASWGNSDRDNSDQGNGSTVGAMRVWIPLA